MSPAAPRCAAAVSRHRRRAASARARRCPRRPPPPRPERDRRPRYRRRSRRPRIDVGGRERPQQSACGSATGWSAAPAPGAWLTSRNSDCCGGSSSTLNSALAALGLSSSTVSTMQTRQPSTAAVEPKNEMVSRVSSTVITVRITPLSLSERSSISSPPWAPAATWRATGSDGSTRASRRACTAAPGSRCREHEARHPVRQCRLADALRRRRSARRAESARCGRHSAMPSRPRDARQRAGFAGMRDRDLRLDLTALMPGSPRCGRLVKQAVAQRGPYARPRRCSGSALASISTQRRGSSAAICR